MATINLGNLTFTHKGDYAGGTAYVKNDVVYYATNGNSYIAKTSTTGNAPTSTSHWDLFVAGASGIWNAGLSLGSANQVVAVNSGGSALEFQNAAEGGLVHMLTQTVTSGTPATVDFIHGTSGVVFDSTYKHYTLMISDLVVDSDNNVFGLRFRKSGSFQSSNYDFATECYEQNTGRNDSAGTGQSYGRLIPRNLGNQSNENFSCRIEIPNPAGSRQKAAYLIGGGRGGNGTCGIMQGACIHTTDNATMDGIQVIMGGGNIQSGIFSLYGMKSS